MSQSLAAAMPAILRHEEVWRGVYRHLDVDGVLLDQHRVTVRCEFPTTGPYAYVQHNRFTWADGRELTSTLPGVLRDGLRNGFKRNPVRRATRLVRPVRGAGYAAIAWA